jgi:polysaccharide biosynthesis transport protein
MEEYVSLKKEMRTQTSDNTVAGLTEEVLRLEKELHKSDQELADFQGTNSVSVIQEQGNAAQSYLTTLNQSLASMKSDYDLLSAMTLDQSLEMQKEREAAASAASTDNQPTTAPTTTTTLPSAEYLKAKQQILIAQAELEEMSQYLRPKHPKVLAKNEEIAHLQQQMEVYKKQSVEDLGTKRNTLGLQITNRIKDIKEWEAKVLESNRKTAEYQRLKSNSQRIQALYDKLLATMQTLDVNKEVSPESVTIMEKASNALPDRPRLSHQMATGAIVGFALGLALLFILDRMDDRITTSTELQDLFDEPILGQIPREKPPGRGKEIALVHQDDDRHSMVEAYRNLRSSLLFMSEASQRPKTLLITSSVPNEGKSLTSANLAITMSSAGSRVLLVDADLRKGVLHTRFGVPCEPGFTEALSAGLNWEEAVQPTCYPNLVLLPRGSVTHKSSEFFINEVTSKFLREAAAKYDYVLLDTAPVMAADDVTSLAPNIDGVAFVIRAETTSARVARTALDLLYQRQVRVLGLVFNAVRPSSVDYYYYYKYKDYYKTYPSGANKAAAAKTQS